MIQVLPAERRQMQDSFELLLGDNLAGRKAHIASNGHLYLSQLDVV